MSDKEAVGSCREWRETHEGTREVSFKIRKDMIDRNELIYEAGTDEEGPKFKEFIGVVSAKYRVCVPAYRYMFDFKNTVYKVVAKAKETLLMEMQQVGNGNYDAVLNPKPSKGESRRGAENWRIADAETFLEMLHKSGDHLPNVDGGDAERRRRRRKRGRRGRKKRDAAFSFAVDDSCSSDDYPSDDDDLIPQELLKQLQDAAKGLAEHLNKGGELSPCKSCGCTSHPALCLSKLLSQGVGWDGRAGLQRTKCHACGCWVCCTERLGDAAEVDRSSGVVVLPFYTQKDVYKEYVIDFHRTKPFSIKPLSTTSFYRVWESKFPRLKVAKTKTGWAACNDCSYFRLQMSNAGSDALRVRYKEAYTSHLDHQRRQRLKYYKHRKKGYNNPSDILSIIMDAMDQAKCDMLHYQRETKKTETDLKLRNKLIGAMVHGIGTFVYVVPAPTATGGSTSIEVLWRTLLKVQLHRINAGFSRPLPPTLYLQFDNASDNKCKAMLAFCAALVEMGCFEKIKINFLIVGHTHEDIDQYFSVIARKLR